MNMDWLYTPAWRRRLGIGVAMTMVLGVIALLQFMTSAPPSGPALTPAQARVAAARERMGEDIRAAGYLHVFDKLPAIGFARPEVLCLEYHNGTRVTTVSPAFLRRFEGHDPPVVAAAQCDTMQGRKTVRVNTSFIYWLADIVVTLSGEYQIADEPRMQFTLWLRDDGAGWEVVGQRIDPLRGPRKQ